MSSEEHASMTQEEIDKFCSKRNPGHHGFIPYAELGLHHLPDDLQREELLEYIKDWGKLVVRVGRTHQSGEKSYTSGYLMKFNGNYFINVSDELKRADASSCEFEFNFDTDDKADVVKCVGIKFFETPEMSSRFLMEFEPIPNFVNELKVMDEQYYFPEVEMLDETGATVAAFPGLVFPPKPQNQPFVLFPGDQNLNKMADVKLKFCDKSVSKLASHWITFEPIPEQLKTNPNCEDYSSCKVLIYTDGEDSTVGATMEFISGHFLLKLLRPLTSEEAQSCVIYFYDDNDSESNGTGIYFMEANLDYARKNGFELNAPRTDIGLQEADDSFWMVSFKPVPEVLLRDLEKKKKFQLLLGSGSVDNVVVGHPHGRKKMVTFGRCVNSVISLTKDGDVDLKSQYTSKACIGSSGSLVLNLRTGRQNTHCGCIHKSETETVNYGVAGINLQSVFSGLEHHKPCD